MIEASKCPSCERVAVPPEEACKACSSPTEPHRLEPEGQVRALTRIDGRWIGLVELEGGARVLAAADGRLEVGDDVGLEGREEGFWIAGCEPDRRQSA